ncbi:MAG: VIT and VWA domain-containing protein [Deltaproteobacteria bacterium]|jgi:Ca-activated chloride channel family protein|nr:VIT and VWA domain-containing protein [Deltaproteobacteria bacterium]
MMIYETSLESYSGDRISLKSVAVKGWLEGLRLNVTLKQLYRNETGRNLEIVYTFPLAYDAELMGLKVKLADQELDGVVLEKKTAERRYEEAIDEGDSPVMVTESSRGLYTMNLGNLKSGEEAEIEYEYAQLLRFHKDQIRVVIPTVVAPRYGDLHKAGELKAHESVGSNYLAQYPLALEIDLVGEAAKARVQCPNHKIIVRTYENRLTVELEPGAQLDRDFVLNLDGLAGRSFASAVQDGEEWVVAAGFHPKMAVDKGPAALKILVDCSGSMEGPSIAMTKRALGFVVDRLNAGDWVSFSRFGNQVAHVSRKLLKVTPKSVRSLLQLIDETEADMGGTELAGALESTLALPWPDEAPANRALLLVTDCEVAGLKGLVEAAAGGGTRIFSLGVGLSPVESHLRRLAEATGGAAEFAGPNEDVSAAIMRLFHRLHTAAADSFEIDWGAEVLWRVKSPLSLFDAETVHLFAGLKAKPAQAPVLSWRSGDERFEARAEELTFFEDAVLPRLAGAVRCRETNDREEAQALALKHRLTGPWTNLFLVRRRSEKAEGIPLLENIPQMPAAGWGGFKYGDKFAGALMKLRVPGMGAAKKRANAACYLRHPAACRSLPLLSYDSAPDDAVDASNAAQMRPAAPRSPSMPAYPAAKASKLTATRLAALTAALEKAVEAREPAQSAGDGVWASVAGAPEVDAFLGPLFRQKAQELADRTGLAFAQLLVFVFLRLLQPPVDAKLAQLLNLELSAVDRRKASQVRRQLQPLLDGLAQDWTQPPRGKSTSPKARSARAVR